MNTLANSAGGVAGAIAGTFGFIALLAAYWVPTITAYVRHVPAKAQIVIVNLFLGWTLIGWVVALVMAFRAVPEPAVRRGAPPPPQPGNAPPRTPPSL